MHDLVIRGGSVVDGTGAPTRTADVAIDGERIVAIGRVGDAGHQEIDASGALVTPGWVDVHTHYDGQATWDPELAPSSWHGVTTAVMGSCGVGFAPVRDGAEGFLIELMEGVEDIPGTALHEGIDWRWNTFSEYLDVLASMPRSLDVGALFPHAAGRAYVMRDRAHDDEIDPSALTELVELVATAVDAGALGFSTSRTTLHRSQHGLVPGTAAAPDELFAVARGMSAVGGGVFQFVSDNAVGDDRDWIRTVAGMPGLTVSYSLVASRVGGGRPAEHIEALDAALEMASQGLRVVPQVPARPVGMLLGLQSSFHSFIGHPAFRPLRDLALAEVVGRLRDPAVRDALLTGEPGGRRRSTSSLAQRWQQIFRLGDPPDYEPAPETSAAAVADRQGRSPQAVVLDWMLERDGTALLFAPLNSYEGDLEELRKMNAHPASIAGLSDGGAHCGLICDASFPTYLLTHWVRDRSRGERLPVELVVHKQTGATASAFGLVDRGTLAPGLLADVNVIDLENLALHAPRMVRDLPAAGRRLVQDVDGYVATVKRGQVTYEHGAATGVMPGGLVRRTHGGVGR